MSLANLLSEEGHPPEDLQTTADVALEQTRRRLQRSPASSLSTIGVVPGVDAGDIRAARAEQAKATCPVSRALAGTEITVDAQLIRLIRRGNAVRG